MQLEDIYDYKNRLMQDLLTSEEIVHLLDEKIDINDAYDKLAYVQVFPSEYVPQTMQDGFTYICFDVDVQQESIDKTFLKPILYIWVFAHRSRMRLPNGEGVRTDKICSEICKKINGSRYYGLGELNLYSVKRFAPILDTIGKVMTFYTREFNRPRTGALDTPANRKNY